MATRRKRIHWLRAALWLLAAALVLPILQTGCVRFVNPPVTSLMLLRAMESPETKRAYQWVDLGKVDRDFVHLALAAEDQRFFQHAGFDWQEIEAARTRAARSKTPVRGASTISMQCARSLFLWPARSWARKGLEAYYTFWLELIVPKRRILELYVNVVEIGPQTFGVEAAARRYYGSGAGMLPRSQAAMLVALLPAPTVWDPHAPSPRLRRRHAHLLRMPQDLPIPGWTDGQR